jgi:hypothetical protein
LRQRPSGVGLHYGWVGEVLTFLCLRSFGPHVSQVVIIMDLKDLSFSPNGHAIPLFKLTYVTELL